MVFKGNVEACLSPNLVLDVSIEPRGMPAC